MACLALTESVGIADLMVKTIHIRIISDNYGNEISVCGCFTS